VAVARRLSIRELIWWILFSSFLFVIIGIVAEVFFGTFRPFASGYRFAGTLHPNGQGIQCGLLLLSALAAADLTKRWRALFWACALLGLVFLILSGSRMALGATTLSLVGYFGAAFSRTAKVAAVCGLGIFFCSLLLFSGPGSLSGIKNAAMLGRIDDPADDNSLNGRTMIWEEAGSYIRQRPILGYGYGGFWTPAHIEAISDKENWGVAASHSAYLDCVLTLGLVGLFMYVVLLIGGIGRAFRFYRASQDPTFAFCGGLLILFAVDGLLDSVILGVSLLLFVCMVVLARLAFLCRLEQPQGHS
jgi:O-antigen ligase